ncbi:MAG: tetratricopeptide repeat protein, partial [Phycisphaerae bacterium]
GIVLNRLGQHDQADKAFMAAIELQPAAAYLRNNLGFSYLLQGRWQDAEAELRNALQLRPDFARARMNLAVVLARQGRFAEALQQMSRAVSAARAYYNLALLYRAAGRYADARRALEQAVALEPGLKIARAQLERLKGLAAADIRQPGAPAQQLARTEQAMHRLDRALPQAQPGPADRPSGSPELAATTQPASGKLRRASLSALYRCVRQMLRPERWAAVWHWARSVDRRRMLAWIDPQARWLAPILVYARLEPHAGKLVWEQVLPEGG